MKILSFCSQQQHLNDLHVPDVHDSGSYEGSYQDTLNQVDALLGTFSPAAAMPSTSFASNINTGLGGVHPAYQHGYRGQGINMSNLKFIFFVK